MRTSLYQVRISDGVKAGNAPSQKNSPQGGFPAGVMIYLCFLFPCPLSVFFLLLFSSVFLLFFVIALPFTRRAAWIQFCTLIPLPILSPIAVLYSVTPYDVISAFYQLRS